MIDAAGAIYVIGGWNGNYIYYSDVWKSADGGAVVEGYAKGTYRVLKRGTKGVLKAGVQGSARGVLQSTECIPRGTRCNHRVLRRA